MTPIKPPRLSPCDEAFSRKLGQANLEQAEQAQPECHEERGDEQVQPGIVRQPLQRRRREEERKEHADRREDPDDRQAIDDGQPGRLLSAPLSLPLLDEEVDRDRHHRPDAGHHQREQTAEAEAIKNGTRPAWAFWAISLWTTLTADGGGDRNGVGGCRGFGDGNRVRTRRHRRLRGVLRH